MEIDEMHRRVAAARVARLGTLSGSGAPHLVPFCFALAGEVLYSAVDRKPKRTRRLSRLRNVAADPRVAVLVDHYEEDWSRLWWIRLDGRALELEAGEEAEGALAQLQEKYPQYAATPPAGPVLRIDVERWQGWSAS
jgi:PPOX class probable F420-dependent enzyme